MVSIPGPVFCRSAGAWVRLLNLGGKLVFVGGLRVGCYGYLCLKVGDAFARVSGSEGRWRGHIFLVQLGLQGQDLKFWGSPAVSTLAEVVSLVVEQTFPLPLVVWLMSVCVVCQLKGF